LFSTISTGLDKQKFKESELNPTMETPETEDSQEKAIKSLVLILYFSY